MQFKTLSAAALFLGLASAYSHPRHFHHRRALNSTVPAGPSTTLTVIATEVHTITSCAVTVTDCPAHPEQATSEFVVTETRTLATTVCPVSDASSISSAIVSSQPAIPSAPLATGSGPSITSDAGSVPTGDTTLTYTLGTGTSTTVVTTTIKHTQTKTVYATPTGLSDSDVDNEDHEEEVGEAGANPSETGNSSGEGSGEPTTTLSSTSTQTKYVTVYPGPSAAGGSSGSGSGSGSGGSGGSGSGADGECAPITVTVSAAPVTVTVAATTLTVTETAAPTSAPSEEDEEEEEEGGEACDAEPATGAPVTSTAGAVDGTPTKAPTDVVVIPSTATVIPVPTAPYGNGTEHTIIPTAAPSASGFIKSYY